jgi:arsenite methyltransferase
MSEELKGQVRRRYAEAALAVRGTSEGDDEASCCGPSCCDPASEASKVDLAGGSYSAQELGELPQTAAAASLGCGNPVALATLSPGEIVLDLGSGGGIDVLLSARRVSPGGKAYGLDMTDEMLVLARKNQEEAGVENVEFLKGEIEEVPLPDEHVDVVISNCVINLSTEKERVIREAHRVLKPGGRFAISDIVFLGDKSLLPAELVHEVEMWSGCVSGALEKEEYERMLAAAGFEEVSIEVTQVHSPETITEWRGASAAQKLREVQIASAFVRAKKPLAYKRGKEKVRGKFEVVEERSGRGLGKSAFTQGSEEQVARLVSLGQALSDPIRVRMLGLMAAATAEGRGCCGLPDLGVPVDEEDQNVGICVCEFEDYFGMGQSKVSYHVRKLKDAGLVEEEKRGKWSFYSLDRDAAQALLSEAESHLFSAEQTVRA